MPQVNWSMPLPVTRVNHFYPIFSISFIIPLTFSRMNCWKYFRKFLSYKQIWIETKWMEWTVVEMFSSSYRLFASIIRTHFARQIAMKKSTCMHVRHALCNAQCQSYFRCCTQNSGFGRQHLLQWTIIYVLSQRVQLTFLHANTLKSVRIKQINFDVNHLHPAKSKCVAFTTFVVIKCVESTHFKIFGCDNLFSNCTSRSIFGRFDRSWFIFSTITWPVVLCVTCVVMQKQMSPNIILFFVQSWWLRSNTDIPCTLRKRNPNRFWFYKNHRPNTMLRQPFSVLDMMDRWACDPIGFLAAAAVVVVVTMMTAVPDRYMHSHSFWLPQR